eukprot:Pgem_evm1s703
MFSSSSSVPEISSALFCPPATYCLEPTQEGLRNGGLLFDERRKEIAFSGAKPDPQQVALFGLDAPLLSNEQMHSLSTNELNKFTVKGHYCRYKWNVRPAFILETDTTVVTVAGHCRMADVPSQDQCHVPHNNGNNIEALTLNKDKPLYTWVEINKDGVHTGITCKGAIIPFYRHIKENFNFYAASLGKTLSGAYADDYESISLRKGMMKLAIERESGVSKDTLYVKRLSQHQFISCPEKEIKIKMEDQYLDISDITINKYTYLKDKNDLANEDELKFNVETKVNEETKLVIVCGSVEKKTDAFDFYIPHPLDRSQLLSTKEYRNQPVEIFITKTKRGVHFYVAPKSIPITQVQTKDLVLEGDKIENTAPSSSSSRQSIIKGVLGTVGTLMVYKIGKYIYRCIVGKCTRKPKDEGKSNEEVYGEVNNQLEQTIEQPENTVYNFGEDDTTYTIDNTVSTVQPTSGAVLFENVDALTTEDATENNSNVALIA